MSNSSAVRPAWSVRTIAAFARSSTLVHRRSRQDTCPSSIHDISKNAANIMLGRKHGSPVLSTPRCVRVPARVIPGGMWGHQKRRTRARRLPASTFPRGEGCRTWDADGRSYIDYMCAWGSDDPGLWRSRRRGSSRAPARRRRRAQRADGRASSNLRNFWSTPSAHADWAMFSKNGTDATTACCRRWHAPGPDAGRCWLPVAPITEPFPWCTPSVAGVTEEDRAHLVHYDYNDAASLEAAAESVKGDLAAIIATPPRSSMISAEEHVLPTREFAQAARRIADAADAALILDDVRAGFRLSMGGSWELVGVKPDLSAWSKAIANGRALAAVTGNDRFREAAKSIFTTGLVLDCRGCHGRFHRDDHKVARH